MCFMHSIISRYEQLSFKTLFECFETSFKTLFKMHKSYFSVLCYEFHFKKNIKCIWDSYTS